MILDKYESILFLIRIITNLSVWMMLIAMYSVLKYNKLIPYIVLLLIEVVIIQSRINNVEIIITYTNEIFLFFVILKLSLLLIINKNKVLLPIKYFIKVISISIILYTLFINLKLEKYIYEIILNLWIISDICISNIYVKIKNNEVNKKKLNINKKYISKISNEIDEESILSIYMNEELKNINSKLINIVDVINMPIIILKLSNLECVFKNTYFDSILVENNYDINNFNFNKFIKEKCKKASLNIIKNIRKMNQCESCFFQLDIANKKYSVVMVKDYIEDQELIICEMKDITEIYKEEEALKKSELRYKNLMDVLTEGIIIHHDNDISYINKICLDIFDIKEPKENKLNFNYITEKINKSNQYEFRNNIILLEDGLKSEVKSQFKLSNGKIVNLISSSFILNNKKMILTIVNDCTEKEIALNKLEENKKTYYTLLQTLPEGIILINKNTKKQEYINKYMMRTLKEIGSEKFNRVIDSYIKDKDNIEFGTFYMDIGKNKRISIDIRPIPKQDNLLIIVRDLQIEKEVEKTYNYLKAIKERNKFKTEFLTRASLDLEKPINTIFDLNKRLDNKKYKYNYPGIENYTKTVKQNSYRLKRILNNISEISRIENNIYDRNYKVYDMVKYLQILVKSSSEYTSKKQLEMEFSSSKREILVMMDKDKIEKILLNILSNAIKFTEKGGKISISLTTDEKDVIIAIKDNGSGIPKNKIDFIFENFEQVNTSLSRIAEGTGVGLYLVKKLAEVHDAKIKVNSKVGYGSKFEIILKDNFIQSNAENRKKVESNTIYREDIELEFSDIYLA